MKDPQQSLSRKFEILSLTPLSVETSLSALDPKVIAPGFAKDGLDVLASGTPSFLEIQKVME
jgi:hypothetical protein